MIVKAAPRLATILWLWKALVDGRSSTEGEHVPLVGELHQSQSQIQFIDAVYTYVGNANGRSRVGHGGRYWVCWIYRKAKRVADERLSARDQAQLSETTVN
jgi:hypothetical protein